MAEKACQLADEYSERINQLPGLQCWGTKLSAPGDVYKRQALGIHGGVMIKKAFICSACEQDIVNLQVDSTNYRAVINKLKEILG